ncbi:hypothetical protein A3K63_04540 [Candidatus Micrarchaeota archaeon RBG_16_49_10]|nr:MAG: hypothetical protein A3K63_04540 [Candidatus Micrarchaeota archaeon RBG_16_49_10]
MELKIGEDRYILEGVKDGNFFELRISRGQGYIGFITSHRVTEEMDPVAARSWLYANGFRLKNDADLLTFYKQFNPEAEMSLFERLMGL